MKKDKYYFDIKVKLLALFLILSIVPVVYLTIYINFKFTKYLQDQGFSYYSNILKQVSSNFDDTFDRYTIKMSELTAMENFKKIINWPPYKTKIEERFFLSDMGEDINTPRLNSLIWSIYTNINGLFCIIETDRTSIVNNTDYKVHYLVDDSNGFRINYDLLRTEPLYQRMLKEGRAVFGKVSKDTMTEVYNRPVLLYPYYSKNTGRPDVILVAVLYEDFVRSLINHPQLINGTVYMLDKDGAFIAATHPSRKDYYEYDQKSGKYILNNDVLFNDTGLSFYDYQKLSTKRSILASEQVKDALLFIAAERNINAITGKVTHYSYKHRTVCYEGITYLLITAYSEKTGAEFLYFIPLSFINRPLVSLLINIMISFIIIIILIICLSILLSVHFTSPIKTLATVMAKAGKGDFNLIQPIRSGDEIQMLYDSYNTMIKDLVITQTKIEAEEDELITTRLAAITALAKLAEYRDESTGKHLERVREYTRILAFELRKNSKYKQILTDKYINDITSSSVLHDIGKVGIESSILLKPGKLTSEEFEIIKTHTTIGGESLSDADKNLGRKSFLTLGKEICFYHHERFDGKGYPEGLVGENIPLSARITALADVYDALTADRCYRSAMSHVEAADIIINIDVGHFDPDVLQCFIENQHKFIEIKNIYKNGE